jgi:hypothetical protein
MPFPAVCRCCGRETFVPESARGTKVWCPRCSTFFAVRREKIQTDMPVPAGVGGAADSLPEADHLPAEATPGPAQASICILTACEICGHESWVAETVVGTIMSCPQCASDFTAQVKKSLSIRKAPLLDWILTPGLGQPPPRLPKATARGQQLPFLAACTFCGRESYVPHGVLGKLVWCAQCSNFFTAAPQTAAAPESPYLVSTELELLLSAQTLPTAAADLEPPTPLPPTATPPDPPASAVETTAPTLPVQARPVKRPQPVPEADADEARQFEPLGASALLLGGAAWLCAWFVPLAGWLVPLSLVALLVGIAAVVRAKRTAPRFRLRLPVGGTTVAAIVLVVGLLFPSLLGPAFRTAPPRQVDPKRQAIFRMMLPNKSRNSGPDDPSWANASRYALTQENVTVQVIEVAVTEQRSLQIRLRIMGEESPGLLKEENRPTLQDVAGKVYKLLDVQAVPSALNEDVKGDVQVAATDALYTFEFPADESQLRLEVPAAVCGGTGVFRFGIPSTMIKRSQ